RHGFYLWGACAALGDGVKCVRRRQAGRLYREAVCVWRRWMRGGAGCGCCLGVGKARTFEGSLSLWRDIVMANRLNRRQFFSAAAVTTAVSLAARAQDAASERIVVGVMGLSRGKTVAEGFARQPNVEVRYVCDVDAQRAGLCADAIAGIEGQDPEPIADFRRILDDAEVDVLVCAAPNHWHAPATILACEAGKHVYV